MLKRTVATVLSTLATLALFGCGDVGNVSVRVSFADANLQAATKTLRFVVREGPMNGMGCAALWSTAPSGLAQSESIIAYPNKNDVVAAAVKLAMYPKLTLLVYAYASTDLSSAMPIAGGCEDLNVDATSTNEVVVVMEKPPGS